VVSTFRETEGVVQLQFTLCGDNSKRESLLRNYQMPVQDISQADIWTYVERYGPAEQVKITKRLH